MAMGTQGVVVDAVDPAVWHGIYDAGHADARAFVFVRGLELVAEAIARLDRPDITTSAGRTGAAGSAGAAGAAAPGVAPAAAPGSPRSLWLDVGCGPGNLSARLVRQGHRVIGIDNDAAMVHFAAGRIGVDAGADGDADAGAGADANADAYRVCFIQGDALRLPVADNVADGVVALSLLGRFASSSPLLCEAFRVLRPGGVLLLTCTHGNSPLLRVGNVIRRFEGRFSAAPFPGSHRRYQLHIPNEMLDALSRAGFTEPTVRFYNLFVNVGRRMFPLRRLALWLERHAPAALCRRLCRNFLIAARKPLEPVD